MNQNMMWGLAALFAAGPALAEIAVDVSDDAAHLGYSQELRTDARGTLRADATALHNTDEGSLVAAGLFVQGDAGASQANVLASLGGRLYYVDSDEADAQSAALGLGGRVRATLPAYDRLGLVGELHWAPEVLSALDGEGLIWASAQVEYQVLRSAVVYAGVRELEADFDADEGSVNIDDGWFLGLQLDI